MCLYIPCKCVDHFRTHGQPVLKAMTRVLSEEFAGCWKCQAEHVVQEVEGWGCPDWGGKDYSFPDPPTLSTHYWRKGHGRRNPHYCAFPGYGGTHPLCLTCRNPLCRQGDHCPLKGFDAGLEVNLGLFGVLETDSS